MNLIKFEKVEKKDNLKQDDFKIELQLERWTISQKIKKRDLIEIRDNINTLLGLTEISQKFGVTIEESEKITKFHETNKVKCKECEFNNILCDKCVLICQSPLERDLMIELKKNNIEAILQMRINKDGTIDQYPTPVDKDRILTIPDFYVEENGSKYAIYTDGYTYHGKTEYQFSRDRSIDRKIQLLGFKVLRYPGDEVRNNLKQIVEQIKQAINM
jgi:very-short-patch-repair endonuclease